MNSVLFLCVHNWARSQMAEAYLKKFAGDLFQVESAGLEPGKLNPYVVRALQEEGTDISSKKTQSVFELYKAGRLYRYVITVCSKEAADEDIMTQVRAVRDEIKAKVRAFAARPVLTIPFHLVKLPNNHGYKNSEKIRAACRRHQGAGPSQPPVHRRQACRARAFRR